MATARIAMEAFREKAQWSAESAAERNRWRLAAQQRARRGPTPEVFFMKRLDNSRLVKSDDPVRRREMHGFAVAAAILFALLMLYSWQHYSSIEYGYRIQAEKTQLRKLQDRNHQLALTEAQLSRSGRIAQLAGQMGMTTPQPGQIVLPGMMGGNPNAPALASVTEPQVAPGR